MSQSAIKYEKGKKASSVTSTFFLQGLTEGFVCMSVCVAKVTMADRAAAERACKDPNPIIDGRKANVNLAYLGAKPRIMQPGEQCLLFPLPTSHLLGGNEPYCHPQPRKPWLPEKLQLCLVKLDPRGWLFHQGIKET